MRILLDTNVLVRLSNAQDNFYQVTRAAVQNLSAENHALCIVPQCLYEYWAVSTRPLDARPNGLGFTAEQAAAEIERFQAIFHFLNDDMRLFTEWRRLVSEQRVMGKQTHDARLAAAMHVHTLDTLLTLNTPDFKRFGIHVLHPQDVNS